MSNRILCVCSIVAAVLVAASASLAHPPDANGMGGHKESEEGKPVTLVGELIDTACFTASDGDAKGKDHAECAQKCLASGVPAGILPENSTDSDAVMFLLTNPQVLAPYAAQTIKVEGTAYEDKHAIDVKHIYVKDGQNWKEVQLKDEHHKMIQGSEPGQGAETGHDRSAHEHKQ